MMKKILSMMLVCVMVVGMVTGCGGGDEQKQAVRQATRVRKN